MFNSKILLASKSPRRSQLLREAGFNFRVATKEVEENYPADMPVEQVPEFLACKKANAAISLLESGEVILTADTVVVLGNTILGKPTDAADARQMLRSLSGITHIVITGVCLKNKEKQHSFIKESTVHLFDLSDEEIDFYIENYKPFDKAGAYGIQEWLGHCKIKKIEGSYPNVMGLPVAMVYAALQEW